MAEEARSGVRALEFFSGIGGLHCGFQAAVPHGQVVAAFDINPAAQQVYEHNFPGTAYHARDIRRIRARKFEEYAADVWLLSPPCQPYTRSGKRLDTEDPRAEPLLHLIEVLRGMAHPPAALVLENVEGFEHSESRRRLVTALAGRGYSLQEFVLSPNQFGVPYMRDRYFLTAWRSPEAVDGGEGSEAAPPPVLHRIPGDPDCRDPVGSEEPLEGSEILMGTEEDIERWQRVHAHCPTLQEFLGIPALNEGEAEEASAFAIPPATVRSAHRSLDVVAPHYRFTRCFTKSYGRYGTGTGSVLCVAGDVQAAREWRGRTPEGMAALTLRYFSAAEMARLHGFPAHFRFPEDMAMRKCFALLGNSLSVTVVTALCRFLDRQAGLTSGLESRK